MFENNFFCTFECQLLIRDVCYSYLVLFLADGEDDSAAEGDLW